MSTTLDSAGLDEVDEVAASPRLMPESVVADMSPAPRPVARPGPADTFVRYVLTAIQWAAGIYSAAGFALFITNSRGAGLLTAFSAFVVFTLAWWVKLQGWRYRAPTNSPPDRVNIMPPKQT